MLTNTANALHQTLWSSVLVLHHQETLGLSPNQEIVCCHCFESTVISWSLNQRLSTVTGLIVSHEIVYCQWFESQPENYLPYIMNSLNLFVSIVVGVVIRLNISHHNHWRSC